MKCICNQYDFDEWTSTYQNYWTFQKDIYMGKLYKCRFCSALWAEYASGHGWVVYYKKNPKSDFKNPELSLKIKEQENYFNKSMIDIWKKILKKLPEETECQIGKIIIPGDIMTVLKFLFKDDKSIRRWLFTFRDKSVQFKVPIDIMEEGGMDIIRFLLLKKYFE